MAGGGSKKKEKCQSPSMKAPPLQPDQVMALGYHDLAEYHCSLDEFSEAYNILKSACLMHDSSPFLHYWRADVSLQYAYCFRFSTDLDKLRDILDEARGAAHRAATMSPCDIEFRRFYISILSEMGFFNEAIRECKQVLSIREDMLFLHFDSQKEQILEKIRHLYNMMEENLDNLGKLLLPMSRNRYLHYSGIKGKRSKSIEINKHMEENDQKRWRKSCWDSMNDEVKAEFLAVKYEDLRTFFLDAPGKIGLTPLLDVFSSAILGIHMRSWECYSCDSEFRDYHSHMMHFEIHVPRMPKPLKDMLPEKKRTSLADIYTKTFLLLFDSAKLVLHMCNGVLLEESFVPGHLKHLLPDPDSFIAWLNVDVHCCKKKGDSKKILKELKELAYEVEELCFEKYLNLVVRKRAFVVAEHLCLEELKKKKHEKPSVKGILQAVENERISRDSSGMSIQIQSQIIVISDLLQNEPSLAKGTGVAKEAHVKILFKRRKELLANECDDINSKMNEKLACYNLKLIELSHACLFDNTTSFMPHLASFFKARLADYVYEHAIEQSEKNANMLISEEAKKNAISEGKPSICRTKKAKKKKRVSKVDKFLQNAHKQEGDLGISLSSTKNGDPLEECNQKKHLEQQKLKLQTDSYVELEMKGEECLEQKRHVIEDTKEESISSSNSKVEERHLIITALDPGSFLAIATQVVDGNSVYQEEIQIDLIPLEGCSKSYAAQILNMNWMTAANVLTDSNDPLHSFVELYTSDDSSTDRSEQLIQKDSDEDEDVFLAMFESAIKQPNTLFKC